MNHERLEIPKAAADEVPPGLTNNGLQKHLGIGYYQVKLWVFHTGYQVKPTLAELPTQSAEDVPNGLCQKELQDLLKVDRGQMKRWCNLTGYQPIDGRSKYSHRPGQHVAETYRAALEAGANKTLKEVGKELGITRERVRQLYVKLKIPREKFPNIIWKDKELVNKIRELAPTAKNTRSIAEAAGIQANQVIRILKIHNIPFKNWIQKRLEQEAATGLRICIKCHEPKPLTEYFRSHRLTGGRYSSCKVCHSQGVKDWKMRTGRPFGKDKKPPWAYDPATGLPWPEGHKPCTVCKQVKPFGEFHLNHSHPTGHTSYCKSCKRIADTGRRKNRHEPVMNGDKLCVDCGRTKPIGEFYVNKACKDGRSAYCKPCLNIRSRKHYERKKAMGPPKRAYKKRKSANPSALVYNSVDGMIKEMPEPIQNKYHELGSELGLTADQINKLKDSKL